MDKRRLKLLVVEDEPDVCTTTQAYFGKRGFLVSTTGSGLEALSMINASNPDIVLLDIALNDLSGLDVLRRLREYDKNTKVIIVTGQMYSDEQIQEVFKLGVSGYEHKPIILEEIERLVNQVVGRKPPPTVVTAKKKKEVFERIPKNFIVHKLTNFLGIIRNKCENFTLNIEEGIYKDKSAEELVKMSVSIMKDIEDTVDRSMEVVEQIKENKKT